MRATRLIPYLFEETKTCMNYTLFIQNTLYIQNKFIYVIYIYKYLSCSQCNKNCTYISCYLSKYSSKITCCKSIEYNFRCRDKKFIYIDNNKIYKM